MFHKSLIIIFLKLSLLFGNDQYLSPVVKSFLVPGWGQVQNKENKRARFFYLTETLILSGYIFSIKYSEYEKSKYISFAAKYADVDIENKERDFWVDIGNYNNIYSFNEEHLRLRSQDVYTNLENNYWFWNDDSDRKSFESMRIKSDYYKKTAQFFLGSLVLNHIVSAIDALYLNRLKHPPLLYFYPKINKKQNIGLELEVKFSIF
tara:strand:+ start:170 stop:787 length:618 start_codon:yes stop_codon:yes gene_type:complete